MRDMRKLKISLFVAMVCAAIVILMTGSSLDIRPGETGVRWEYPQLIAANDNGEMVVENECQRNLTILDSSGRVSGVIDTGVDKNGFQRVLGLAMSSNSVYVVDALNAEIGEMSNGVRIVRFAFDGTYMGTVHEDRFSDVHTSDQSLKGLFCEDGRLYAFRPVDGVGSLCEFVDGRRDVVCSVPLQDFRVHTLQYLPKTSLLVVSFDSGETCLWHGLDPNAKPERCEEMRHLHHVVCDRDGTLYWSDRRREAIFRRHPGRSAEILVAAWADHLALVGDKLYFTDRRQRDLRVCDLATAKVSNVDFSPYATGPLWRSRVAWASVAIFAVLALAFLSGLAVSFLRRYRAALSVARQADPDAPMGMAALYGRNLLLTFVIFVVVTATLSVEYYNDLEKSGCDAAANAATLIRNLSAGEIGDLIAAWDGTPDQPPARQLYRLVRDICQSCSISGTDLDGVVLRFKEGGDTQCLLTLNERSFGAGDLINDIAERRFKRSTVEADARVGKITQYSVRGFHVFTAPIRDSQGRLQAVAYLNADGRHTVQLLLKRIGGLSVDLLSQLLVLVMIFGECQLLVMFLKKRRAERAAKLPPRTMCEIQRPIRIIWGIVASLYLAFLPTLSARSAATAGLTGGVLTTLPLVALSFGFYAGRMLLQDLCSRSPLKSLWAGSIGLLAFVVMMTGFGVTQNYGLLVGAMLVQAVSSAVIDCACMSLRGCGIEPDRKFRLLVFTNMEPAIGVGIGVALGAFLFANLGLGWVTGLVAVLALVVIVLGTLFVGHDIDASPRVSPRAKLGATLRFCLSPYILAIVLCVTMPIGIFSSFETYALPVFNEESGNSVVLVGFVLVVAKFLTLFVLPPVIRRVDHCGNVTGMTIASVCLLGSVLLFALSPSLVMMVCVVLVFGIADAVMTTCAERQEVEEAARCGVPYDSASKFLVIGESVSYSIGAPLFCWLMAGGYDRLGFCLFFGGVALLAVFLLVARSHRVR